MAEGEKVRIERRKEFLYRGKSLEELKKLDVREFAKFIPSRERRTLLRNTEKIENFLLKCRKKSDKNKPIKTHDRNIIIVPQMVGLELQVYNGQVFERVSVVSEMLGHRLGEFALTRRQVKHGTAGIGATRSSASRSVK